MPLQFRPTTSNITLKEGAMVNLLVGTHLNSRKLSLGSLIPTVSPRTARTQDINLRIIIPMMRRIKESEDESEEEDEDESAEENSEDEFVEEEDHTEEEESEDEKGEKDEEEIYNNKRTSFIATLFNDKEIKEEVPIKCNDPGPCLVTCKIKGVEVRECLCDPGACSSVMPYVLYKFLKLGTLKKTKEIFTTADASIVSVVGIA
ncbi:hypothetical protein PIB30_048304 [Stylosanthes scabra]|uniref:Uncharacterized protein n=1 Tax=Stylosanthes scabra TaxID=79078 RepID=A0ABU6WJR5_9FABA|nr:hypothetical protein [Stylosanthes scabra]